MVNITRERATMARETQYKNKKSQIKLIKTNLKHFCKNKTKSRLTHFAYDVTITGNTNKKQMCLPNVRSQNIL